MAMTRQERLDSIHNGILAANRMYARWSNGYLVKDSGVEGLMVACVAASIHRKQTDQESLWIEVPFADIRRMAEARVRGRPPTTLASQNRADLVLFNARGQPTTVIELKRKWDKKPCLDDLVRVRELVLHFSKTNNGTLRRGFVGLSIAKQATLAKPAEQRIREQVRKIEDVLQKDFSASGCNVSTSLKLSRRDYDGWKVASLVVEVVAQNRR